MHGSQGDISFATRCLFLNPVGKNHNSVFRLGVAPQSRVRVTYGFFCDGTGTYIHHQGARMLKY